MSGAPGQPTADPQTPRARLAAIAAALAESGMGTRITSWAGGDELNAWSPRQHGRHAAEIVIDQEGYLEIRHWGGLAADPAVAAATIAGVLASLTGPDAASPGQPV